MQKLIRGIHDFQNSISHTQRELFEKFSAGQSPDTLFITCSDSRINPNLITQTQPGDPEQRQFLPIAEARQPVPAEPLSHFRSI